LAHQSRLCARDTGIALAGHARPAQAAGLADAVLAATAEGAGVLRIAGYAGAVLADPRAKEHAVRTRRSGGAAGERRVARLTPACVATALRTRVLRVALKARAVDTLRIVA